MKRQQALRLAATAALALAAAQSASQAAAQALAQSASPAMAAGGMLATSRDSEGFSSRRLSVEAVTGFRHLDGKTGLRYTDHQFWRDGWRRSGEQLRFVTHQIDRRTADGWLVEAGVFRQSVHELVTLDASYRKTPIPGTTIEGFASRDFVETRNALELGTHFNFAGVAVDHQLTPRLTVVGLLAHQAFSDDNQRRHARARLIYQPWPELGLTLQLRYRTFDSSKEDVARAYFNPKRYEETLAAVSWRQRSGDWRTALTAGLGVQRIDQADSSGTRLLEGLAEKQVATYALRLRAGYSRAAAAAASDPAYWYSYAIGELLVPF